MSDPTSQPPAWNPDNERTLPYGVPPGQSQQGPYNQPQQGPYNHPQQGPYTGLPQPPYVDQRQHLGHHQPPPRSKTPWILAAAIAVVVALIGGVAVVLLTRPGSSTTTEPIATYSDGVSTPSPSDPPTSSSPTPTPTPKPTPTPTERTRTLKDIDEGIKVYDDVYIKPATGWRKNRASQYSVTLGSRSRAGAVMVVVNPVGYPARVAVGSVAQALITADHLKGVRKSAVKTLSPANSNIGSQAQLSYSGRYTASNGGVFTLVAKCTTMTGVESIHNATVTVCVAACKDAQAVVFRDGARMLASVARSI
ncbi:hypothetical protein EV646_10556 [Kribbella antiqua]|uniref:Uncharacterized protein n=1 Tax=Kribbella antiqua TaxID=2512217 RepID=A0A4R2IR99_9ACTN|nr:hypothetical protein [Kribbella antiqua]TCO47507.1 hypothetical protein EV646_10556 [Kribbella antiqua]